MAVKSVTYYRVECDEPECDVTTSDLGEYSAWGDEWMAIDNWVDSDGVKTPDGRTFCEKHRGAKVCDVDHDHDTSDLAENEHGETVCKACREADDA